MTVQLRKLLPKDADGMLEWMRNKEIQRAFRKPMGSKTMSEVLAFIEDARTEPVQGESVHFAIVAEDDEYLGTISLKNIDLVAKDAEYAIAMRQKGQGMGVGTIATGLILKVAFEDFGLDKVYLNVLSDNETAMHVYEKNGFVCEGESEKNLFLDGEYKSLKWYRILREEWESRRGEPEGRA